VNAGVLVRPWPRLIRLAPEVLRRLGPLVEPTARLARHAVAVLPPPWRGLAYAGALRAVASQSVAEAIELGEALLPAEPEARERAALARVLRRGGAIARPLTLLDAVAPERRPRRLDRDVRIDARLLAEPIESAPRTAEPPWPASRRVLYYASQSLPHHSSGYATRTHGLVASLRGHGWEVEVDTRLGYPNDRYDFSGVRRVATEATIDGVPYRFTPDRARGVVALDHDAYQEASVAMLIERARALRPTLIHAASNHVVGLAAVEAARRLGLPSIYEVRGMWHMTRAAAEPAYQHTEHYRLIARLEARAAAGADHVFTITAAVADLLADEGVPRARMSVLPNAVDVERFAVSARDRELAARWGIGDLPVIGYVGSFKHYEGLELLIEAAARLRARRGDSFRVLLVGDGEAYTALQAQARALGLDGIVVFTGRQPHAEIERYYSIIDILAFPRHAVPVCEAIAPIKPFEAMAMERAVVVSGVAALREIVEHEVTGLVHRPGDADDLAGQLERYLQDPGLARAHAQRGAAWVREHRSWARVTAAVDAVYRELR
jgi:glycosyltransferase involved in cell wall biosynthesis